MSRLTAGTATFLMMFGILALGQSFRGGVSGSVTNQSGAIVGGATVRLLGTDPGLTRTG